MRNSSSLLHSFDVIATQMMCRLLVRKRCVSGAGGAGRALGADGERGLKATNKGNKEKSVGKRESNVL